MPANSRGIVIPADSDSNNLPPQLRDFEVSMLPHIRVASAAAATQARSQFVADGGRGPALFFRTDIRQTHVCWQVEDPQEPLDFFAGRQYGATVTLVGEVEDAKVTTLKVESWQRPGVGFGVSADSTAVTIPATGYYMLAWNLSFNGTAANMGRTFGQLILNRGLLQFGRQSALGENVLSGSGMKALGGGQEIQVAAYHESGGKCTARVTMDIVQTLGAGPSW